jgi:hypothetical protein
MNERFRIYAAVALTGLVILGGGFIFLSHGSASSTGSVHQIKPLHPRAKAKVALAPPKVGVAMAQRKSSSRTRTPSRRPTSISGVPTPLADALKRHSVVVVALVSPKSTVDSLTLAEAKAGAAAAHAGFATIDVRNNAQVQALSALVSSSADPQNRLLDDPAVLIFQHPRTLYIRLNGYVDADTVEQAVVNAAPLSAAR